MARFLFRLPKTGIGWLACSILAFWLLQVAGVLLPASLWYEVNRVEVVEPVYAGGVVELSVSRSINRSFSGEYDVVIVDESSNAIVCENGGSLNYQPDRSLLNPLTLDWWLNASCPLVEGNYHMVTRWEIEWSPFDLWDKRVSADTFFSVLPARNEQSQAEPMLGVQLEILNQRVEELSTELEALK